jgi:transposase InsO family protein
VDRGDLPLFAAAPRRTAHPCRASGARHSRRAQTGGAAEAAAKNCGVSRRKWLTNTVRDRAARPASDQVQRNFAAAPNRLRGADITYIPTWRGLLYLAVVLDAFSRIVGWAMATSVKSRVGSNALNMALQQRRPISAIHHSDQGSQTPRSLWPTM